MNRTKLGRESIYVAEHKQLLGGYKNNEFRRVNLSGNVLTLASNFEMTPAQTTSKFQIFESFPVEGGFKKNGVVYKAIVFRYSPEKSLAANKGVKPSAITQEVPQTNDLRSDIATSVEKSKQKVITLEM